MASTVANDFERSQRTCSRNGQAVHTLKGPVAGGGWVKLQRSGYENSDRGPKLVLLATILRLHMGNLTHIKSVQPNPLKLLFQRVVIPKPRSQTVQKGTS